MQVQYHQQNPLKMGVLSFVGVDGRWGLLRGIGHGPPLFQSELSGRGSDALSGWMKLSGPFFAGGNMRFGSGCCFTFFLGGFFFGIRATSGADSTTARPINLSVRV
jgi:hypothetical protein